MGRSRYFPGKFESLNILSKILEININVLKDLLEAKAFILFPE